MQELLCVNHTKIQIKMALAKAQGMVKFILFPAPALTVRSTVCIKQQILTLENLNSKTQFRHKQTFHQLNLVQIWTNQITKCTPVIKSDDTGSYRSNGLRNVSNGWMMAAISRAKEKVVNICTFDETSNSLVRACCCLHVLQSIYIHPP